MSNNLSDTRLTMLHVQTSKFVRKIKDRPDANPFLELNAREVNVALEELMRRRKLIPSGYKARHEITEWMIAAKVGDRHQWPEVTQGRLNTYRSTARAALRNPLARWSMMSIGNGEMELERIEDGANANSYRHRSFIVGVMAHMNVNGRVTVPNPYSDGRIPAQHKITARQVMGKPDADWKYKTLARKRTRITRIK